MRCAIYTRVSTDEQARPDYNSLATQAEICRHYAEAQREQGDRRRSGSVPPPDDEPSGKFSGGSSHPIGFFCIQRETSP